MVRRHLIFTDNNHPLIYTDARILSLWRVGKAYKMKYVEEQRSVKMSRAYIIRGQLLLRMTTNRPLFILTA